AGNAYVAGDTSSPNFPVTGYQRSIRVAPDAFVAKLSADGSRLLYSTYLGGTGEDHAKAVAVDSMGSALVTGSTYSPDFPVAGAFQAIPAGGQDVFVAKFSVDGQALIFSTFLGGSGGSLGSPEEGRGIAVDPAGAIYVAGVTSSTNFPVMA